MVDSENTSSMKKVSTFIQDVHENSSKRILQKVEGYTTEENEPSLEAEYVVNIGPASVKFHATVNVPQALSILKVLKSEVSNEYIEFIDTCISFSLDSIWVDTRDTPLKIVAFVLIHLYRELRVICTWCIGFISGEDQGVIYLSGGVIDVVTISDLVEFYKIHSIEVDKD